MRFDIVTIFPNIFDSYFNESIIKRAREKKIVDIRAVGIRDFASGKYKKLDEEHAVASEQTHRVNGKLDNHEERISSLEQRVVTQ